MATVIGVGMQMTASASGLTKGLSEADKALATLEANAQKNKAAFREFSGILSVLPGPLGDMAGRMSGFVSAADGLNKVFAGGINTGLTGLGTALGGLVNPTTLAVAGIAAVGAAAAGITTGLANLSGRVESLSLLAQRLGTSFDFVQVLEEAAARSGGSVDELAGAMQRFAVRVDEARGGTGRAAVAFAELGISQEQLISSSPVEIATQTALALQKIEDPARRAALATETLGKQGLALVPAFASLGEAEAAMQRFSAAISDIDATRLNSLDDSFDDVGTALRGLGQNLLLPFAGLADGVASLIADAIAAVTKAIDPLLNAVTPILDAVGLAFEGLGEVIFAVGDTAGKIFDGFGATVGRVANIVSTAAAALGQSIAEVVGDFLEFTGLGDVISGLASTVGDAFDAIVGTIGDAIASVSGFVDGVLTWAEDWLGIKADVENPITVTVDTASLDDATMASEELQKILNGVQQSLNDAIEESAQFGQAGFDAAFQYQEALKKLKEQFDAGILNEEAYKRAIEQATASYNAQIDAVRKVAEEAEKRAAAEQAAAQKIIDENKKISDALLEQLRIEQEFGGDNARARAAENVRAVEEEIARVQEEQRLANAEGRMADAEAAAARLARLDQVVARERDIASGAAAERKREEEFYAEQVKAAEAAAKEQERRDSERRRKLEEYANQIHEIEVKFAEQRFEIEKARLEELSKIRGGALEIGDFREGGSDIFLDLLAGKQDEAIEEYRNQLRELRALRKDIQKLEIKKAEILGGVG